MDRESITVHVIDASLEAAGKGALIMSDLFALRQEPIEFELQGQGHTAIVGCDEAGRGPLAGPVVAAAVLFRDCDAIWKCKDSKSLSQLRRETLFAELEGTVEFAVAVIEADEIDKLNIRVSSLTAMSLAVKKLPATPSIILVDGRDRLLDTIMSRAIIKGDSLVATISAASIAAKVTRDRIMRQYAEKFPEYGFDCHFGYPTASHRDAIKKFGPCPIHRRSYRGVREFVEAP